MLLSIHHDTRYDYTPAVETAQHVAVLKPATNAMQELLQYSLTVSPEPDRVNCTPDVYGNERAFFALQVPHDSLLVSARSLVRTRPGTVRLDAIRAASPTWEAVRERFRYHAGLAYDAASEFCFASPLAPKDEAFAAYARPSFGPGVTLADAALSLTGRIHDDFTFDPHSTEVNTPAIEALVLRRGVCQDFAHVMLACLRSMGLPARYVSGYLLTQPPPGQPKLIGSDASHAWVSVYLPPLGDDGTAATDNDALPGPDGRWLDLCPTNNRAGLGSPGEDYVTLATGRDYADVSPMRGVIHGGARHTLHVGVTVEAIEEEQPVQAQTETGNGGGMAQSQSQSQ